MKKVLEERMERIERSSGNGAAVRCSRFSLVL